MIIVTGAGGFVGSYVVKDLVKSGYEVIATGRKSAPLLALGCGQRAYLDVTNRECFSYLPKDKVEAVVHCAALLMIDGHAPEEYFRVNTIGTFNVMEYCREVGARLIYTMTHSDINDVGRVYVGENVIPLFMTPSFEAGKNSLPFIQSKVSAAEMIYSYARAGTIRATILRLSNIRGVGSRDEKYNCVFHQFVQKALRGDNIEIWGEAKTIRDLIYIKDVSNAVIKTLENPTANGLYNIGSGVGLTIRQEAEAIIAAFDSKSELVFRPDIEEYRKRSCVFKVEKARKELGWSPRYGYYEAMKDYRKELENKTNRRK